MSGEMTVDNDATPRNTASTRAVETGEPLNFSFLDMDDVAACVEEPPRAGKTVAMVEAEATAKEKADAEKPKTKAVFSLDKPKRTRVARPRPVTTVLKLNNNNLSTLAGLDVVLPRLLHDPFALTMLDVSFNALERVEEVITQFENLCVLYLQGNKIDGPLSTVDKLGRLPKLRSLALHGNPIDQNKSYRLHVIGAMPNLRTLDFTTLTARDRERAAMHRRARRAPKPAED